MATPTIQKDADLVLPFLYEGDEDLTDASITWALLPWKPTWSKDLDTLISDEALFAAKTVGSGVTIVDSKHFTVAIDHGDTHELKPGEKWILVRIVTSGSKVLGIPAVKVILAA